MPAPSLGTSTRSLPSSENLNVSVLAHSDHAPFPHHISYASAIQLRLILKPQSVRTPPSSPDLPLASSLFPSTKTLLPPDVHFVDSSNCYASTTMPSFITASVQQTAKDYISRLTTARQCQLTLVQGSRTGVKDTSTTVRCVSHLEQRATTQGTLASQNTESQNSLRIQQADNYCTQARTEISSSSRKKMDGNPSNLASASFKQIPPQVKTGKPKRALTAYNIFFKEQRERILAERRQLYFSQADNQVCKLDNSEQKRISKPCQKVGFEEMGKTIGQRWKEVDTEKRLFYEARARAERQRYSEELAEYMLNERSQREAKFESLQASVSEETKRRYFAREK